MRREMEGVFSWRRKGRTRCGRYCRLDMHSFRVGTEAEADWSWTRVGILLLVDQLDLPGGKASLLACDKLVTIEEAIFNYGHDTM